MSFIRAGMPRWTITKPHDVSVEWETRPPRLLSVGLYLPEILLVTEVLLHYFLLVIRHTYMNKD